MTSLVGVSASDPDWLKVALDAVSRDGFVVVTGVLPPAFLERARDAIRAAREGVLRDVGAERLKRAGELGTIRLPFKYHPLFFEFLVIPEVISIVDRTVGNAAILHLLNAFALPSFDREQTPVTAQNSFHRDFPRYMEGYVASINAFFAIDRFTEENGATIVVPGSHQARETPQSECLNRSGIAVEAPAGAMLLFDSTLWHSAGRNVSGADRMAVNMQFTRSYIKQQIDYVRALGDDVIATLPERSQQLLGWYTRVVTSLDEYYRPEAERLYRRGQG